MFSFLKSLAELEATTLENVPSATLSFPADAAT
jgi:hypothetical protein